MLPITFTTRSGAFGAFVRSTTAALALGAVLATGTAAAAGPLPATADDSPLPDGVSLLGESCGDDGGVTVVVDFPPVEGQSEGEGEVRVGCAPEVGVTGTEALRAAGFTDTRDAASMICAISSYPDPCPEAFAGVYWSYWYADAEGDWQAYLEGSDTAVTQAGRVEGWRYSDGSEGPRIAPAVVAGTSAGTAATTSADETAEITDAPVGTDDGGMPGWVWAAGGAVVLALLGLAVSAMRRSPGTGADA